MGILIGVGANRPTFPYDYFYGIEFDTAVSQSPCVRIGRAELHKTLPVQSQMRRCIVNDKTGEVVNYLNATDSTKYDNGAPADLTGASGQVMVELPEFYRRFEAEGTKRRVMFSLFALPGFEKVPLAYVSAYQATVKRSAKQLCSVVNKDPDFRGGGNQKDWDSLPKSMLGKPAAEMSLGMFRDSARQGRSTKWNCYTYQAHVELYWLFVVEYATLNCQSPFNAEPTAEGFKQGGLGPGVTTLSWDKWNAFNGYRPLVPCGVTNSLGNASGFVKWPIPKEYDPASEKAFEVDVPSYRGVENPFGHIYVWLDGVLVNIQSDDAGGRSIAYTCDDPKLYASVIGEGYNVAGDLARKEGWVKEICFGAKGHILPMTVGGSSTTYFGDYSYTTIPTSGESLRGLFVGGCSVLGSAAGFVFARSSDSPANAGLGIGSRLCFYPES